MPNNTSQLYTVPEETLKETLKQLPKQPGVYRYYDSHHKLLYVGKAKNLKSRVSSYFHNRGKHQSPRTERLISNINHLELVITDNEYEALILEDNLIKTHRPPYNINLKDDKRYPWIVITDEPFPRVLVTRRMTQRKRYSGKQKNKTKVFGPYSNVGAMHATLKVIRKHFPIRQRKKPLFVDRPCMNYSIGTCPGPCQQLITPEDYDHTIEQVTQVLKGQTTSLLKQLHADMQHASESMNFEWAAKCRDRASAIENLLSTQQIANLNDLSASLDVFGHAADENRMMAVVWRVREGRLVNSTTHTVLLEHGLQPNEALEEFLPHYYGDLTADQLPDEILIDGSSQPSEQLEWLSEWLAEWRLSATNTKRSKLPITTPKRGDKAALLEGATRNAKNALDLAQTDAINQLQRDPTAVLHELQTILGLKKPLKRMECYDISHIQGRFTVASMVVFTDGFPDKAEYRRFNIQTAEGMPDDFASMAEALSRRAKRIPDNTIKMSRNKASWPEPDLIIIDGGKGQLSSAKAAMDANGIGHIPTISLAKRLEEIFIPEESKPIVLPRESSVMYLLQQIRDEAHRFAITSHRKRREKNALASNLDDIPGVGEKRRQQLLAVFNDIEGLKAASEADLIERGHLPPKVAQAVYEHLNSNATKA